MSETKNGFSRAASPDPIATCQSISFHNLTSTNTVDRDEAVQAIAQTICEALLWFSPFPVPRRPSTALACTVSMHSAFPRHVRKASMLASRERAFPPSRRDAHRPHHLRPYAMRPLPIAGKTAAPRWLRPPEPPLLHAPCARTTPTSRLPPTGATLRPWSGAWCVAAPRPVLVFVPPLANTRV